MFTGFVKKRSKPTVEIRNVLHYRLCPACRGDVHITGPEEIVHLAANSVTVVAESLHTTTLTA